MLKILNSNWFTEINHDMNSAFSLAINRKLHEERTAYQLIEIYDTESFGNLMVIDGAIMLTTKDNFIYHEMISHPVLFTHQKPEEIAIIGGGDCGTLTEVLKHKEVCRVQQIEIDERVTRLAEQYFPELCKYNQDPRVNFYFTDGIEWMATTKADSLDVIIVDSTDPLGPAEGLFTEMFYASCYRALKDSGLLIQQTESPIYHLNLLKAVRAAMYAVGFNALNTLTFPQVVYPSGWHCVTMARKNAFFHEFREKDAINKPFPTVYYNASIHKAAQVLPEFLQNTLD